MGSHDLEKSTTAMDDAGDRLSKYFLGMTAINAGFGVIIGVGLWMIGVPSPVLWGVLAMLMRFVPFIGSFIAAACPLMLAAAVDPGWSMFLWTLALYAISEPIMGSVIEPLVQSHRTGLSPLAIILVGRVLDAAVGTDRPAARHSADGRARRSRPPCRAARVSERGARRHAAAVTARALLSAHAGG